MRSDRKIGAAIKQVANTGQLAALKAAVYGVRHSPPNEVSFRKEVLGILLEQAKKQGIPQPELDAVLRELDA